MNDQVKSTIDLDDASLENVRLGYDTSINLWTYQGNLNWSRFNAMLTANSIIMAVIGFVLSSQLHLFLFKIFLPIVGLTLCIVWIFLMARGEDYRKYWHSCALKLEENHLKDVIKTISEAKSVSKGGKIEFRKISKIGGSQQKSIFAVIAVFIIIYVVTFMQIIVGQY